MATAAQLDALRLLPLSRMEWERLFGYRTRQHMILHGWVDIRTHCVHHTERALEYMKDNDMPLVTEQDPDPCAYHKGKPTK